MVDPETTNDEKFGAWPSPAPPVKEWITVNPVPSRFCLKTVPRLAVPPCIGHAVDGRSGNRLVGPSALKPSLGPPTKAWSMVKPLPAVLTWKTVPPYGTLPPPGSSRKGLGPANAKVPSGVSPSVGGPRKLWMVGEPGPVDAHLEDGAVAAAAADRGRAEHGRAGSGSAPAGFWPSAVPPMKEWRMSMTWAGEWVGGSHQPCEQARQHDFGGPSAADEQGTAKVAAAKSSNDDGSGIGLKL